MRLRNVPGAREVMVENEYVFTEPEGMCGTWKEVFGNDNPIHIEIGMGKGTFITPRNKALIREKQISIIEKHIEQMVDIAKISNISKEEVMGLFNYIYEEE